MIDRTISVLFYAKCWKEESLISSGLSPPLYIDRRLSLPSLCKASHNSGWGEGFSQEGIECESDCDLYVYFGHSKFRVQTEQELKGIVSEQELTGMEGMGGIS